MNKIKLEVSGLIDKFEKHNEIKDKLINLINNSGSHLENKDIETWEYHISKCDWNNNEDFENREWVNFLKPYMQKQFDKFANKMLYQKANIKRLWYQQYKRNDAHGWHIHGETYTGVYYLQLPNGSSKTELINHYEQDKNIQIATLEANEGDIVIFPSFVIHRAPKIINDVTKTIISFNLEFEGIKESIG